MNSVSVAIMCFLVVVAWIAYKEGRVRGNNAAWRYYEEYDIPRREEVAKAEGRREAWSSLEKPLWRVRDLTHNMPDEWGVPAGLSPEAASYIRSVLVILPLYAEWSLLGRIGSPPCPDIPSRLIESYPSVFTPEVVAEIEDGRYDSAVRAAQQLL